MVVFLKKTLLTFILLALSIWLIRYGMIWQTANDPDYTFEKSKANDSNYFAGGFYNSGINAWFKNNPEMAINYLRKALLIDRFHMNAWLKMAEIKMAQGNTHQASQILNFSHNLTKDVVEWKWQKILVARELPSEEIFFDNINFIIPYRQFQEEAIYLMDRSLASDTPSVLNVMETANFPYYLYWLMKWQRIEDSFQVWTELSNENMVDDHLYDRYVHYLISRREIQRAAAIRKQYMGDEGITNPGFELPLSNRGFGWRRDSGEHWNIQRVSFQKIEGNYSLQIRFSGNENINFRHLRQIVPVLPGNDHVLSFWWRSRNLTTDQRPFIEIIGLDCKNSYWKSEMIPSTTGWRKETIFFSVPEECHAVTVRLRRQTSHRFDNKISGEVWLDQFNLETLNRQQFPQHDRSLS